MTKLAVRLVILGCLAWALAGGAGCTWRPAQNGVGQPGSPDGATTVGAGADGAADDAREDRPLAIDRGTFVDTGPCGTELDQEGCPCAPGSEPRPCFSENPSLAGIGVCVQGTQACRQIDEFSVWGTCQGQGSPAEEICDGLDNDCDGTTDEGCACRPGETRACYGGPPGTMGVGACAAGTQACAMGAQGSSWGDCAGQTLPGVEVCDQIDNDCDGAVDEGCDCRAGDTRACYEGPAETRHVGSCADGTQTCIGGDGGVGSSWGSCLGQRLPGAEVCNGADDDCDGAPDDGLDTPPQVLMPRTVRRDVDMLFMIDDSLSMQPIQTNLVANFPVLMQTLRNFPGGLPNLHLAVVTSDLGFGQTPIPQCRVGGDGGIFHAPPAGADGGATCQGPTDRYIVASQSETIKNYPGTIEQAFSCIANVGTTGCGFEHQLASAARALGYGGGIPPENAGFLRPDALLAIIFITNEDDCSGPPDSPMFVTTSASVADPYGQLSSFRCNEFGHLCGGVRPPRNGTTPVTLTGCRSAEDGVLMLRVADLADYVKSLKPDPAMIFVSVIAAPVTPYTVQYVPIVGGTEIGPAITHSCAGSDGSYGDPAVRMAEFADHFGANGISSSICDSSYAPALSQLGATLGRALEPLCLDVAVSDHDATKPGIQASCQVVERAPGQLDATLAACAEASPQGGPVPCWYLASSDACPSGVRMLVNRDGNPPAGSTLLVRCSLCR